MSRESKHSDVAGFCQETMADRVKKLNKYKGEWRRIDKKTIMYTNLLQTWKHVSGEVIRCTHFSPWGMKQFIEKQLTQNKCKQYRFLPAKVRESKFCSTKEVYKEADWTVSISNTGQQPAKSFNRLYCTHCNNTLLPKLLEKYKEQLSGDLNLVNLINNWDILKVPDAVVEYVGCFIPWNKDAQAGPSSRHFIREPADHAKVAHAYTITAAPSKRVQKQASMAVPSKTMALDKDVVVVDDQSPSSSQTKLVGKNRHNQPSANVILPYLQNIGVKGPSPNEMTEMSKEFCCSVVHIGCKKMMSNVAIIENYEAGFSGQERQYEYYKKYLLDTFPEARLPAPVKLSLNTHSIVYVQRAILDTYRYDDDTSSYAVMRKSPFWSLMHDGIAKFGTEYNGVCLRALNSEYDPISVPFVLQPMKGGVTAIDTAHAIIDNIGTKLSIKNSALDEILSYLNLRNPDDIVPKPPSYFKLGKLSDVQVEESKEIHIELDQDMPICNTGDGVSVNIKAARVLRDFYGFMSPHLRCAAHVADGTLKRLAKSKTMNVEEVTLLYNCLRTIIKHFEASIKNKELLDECMEILDMSPINLISWCQTRMAHFLTACVLVDDSLAAMYDAMYHRGIRVDERDTLFTAVNIFIIKLLKDIEPSFQKLYLRKADKADCLASTVYNTQRNFAETMKTIVTNSADDFKRSLRFDGNGNLLCTVKVKESEHTLTLNHTHKASRNVTEEERLQKIKDTLTLLKTTIKSNMVDNILDQCSDETFFYNWSGLDLDIQGLSTQDRLERLHDLITIFCSETTHLVSKYANTAETKLEADQYFGYNVYLHYPKKIDATVDELKEQTKTGLNAVGPIWLTEINAAKHEKRPRNQLAVWKEFIRSNALQYPLFCQLLMINIATASNTSPLERSYTQLQMVTEKRRNRVSPENLEIRWLIAALNIPVKKTDEYQMERERLEKM